MYCLQCEVHYFRYSDNVLTDKDAENVYELVYSSHRAVAQAAGEFLNAKLFTREPEEPAKTKQGTKRSVSTPLMRDLVQFFIESEVNYALFSFVNTEICGMLCILIYLNFYQE